MVSVGVLTFHWANHIGAVLQAYCMQSILSDLGFDVEFINYIPKLESLVKTYSDVLKIPRKYSVIRGLLNLSMFSAFRTIVGELANSLYAYKMERLKNEEFEIFRKSHLKLTKPVTSLTELKQAVEKYDYVVVGDDQVWNPIFLMYSDYAYILPFKTSSKKMALAASIGVDPSNIPNHILNYFRLALRDFDFISVREKRHVSILSKLIGRDIYHIPDPVLLVRSEILSNLEQRVEFPFDEFIMVYNLDPTILPVIDKISEDLGLPVVIYSKPYVFPLSQYLQYRRWGKYVSIYNVGPKGFIYLIKKASYVITNSYHGVILSIRFKKSFAVVLGGVASKAPSRIIDLLEELGLLDRVVSNRSKLINTVKKDIDWNNVNLRVEEMSKNAYTLLREAFKR